MNPTIGAEHLLWADVRRPIIPRPQNHPRDATKRRLYNADLVPDLCGRERSAGRPSRQIWARLERLVKLF